jgi:hypothetical protein
LSAIARPSWRTRAAELAQVIAHQVIAAEFAHQVIAAELAH